MPSAGNSSTTAGSSTSTATTVPADTDATANRPPPRSCSPTAAIPVNAPASAGNDARYDPPGTAHASSSPSTASQTSPPIAIAAGPSPAPQ